MKNIRKLNIDLIGLRRKRGSLDNLAAHRRNGIVDGTA